MPNGEVGGGGGLPEIFLKFNMQGDQNKRGVGISKNPLISVTNGKRDINIQY